MDCVSVLKVEIRGQTFAVGYNLARPGYGYRHRIECIKLADTSLSASLICWGSRSSKILPELAETAPEWPNRTRDRPRTTGGLHWHQRAATSGSSVYAFAYTLVLPRMLFTTCRGTDDVIAGSSARASWKTATGLALFSRYPAFSG